MNSNADFNLPAANNMLGRNGAGEYHPQPPVNPMAYARGGHVTHADMMKVHINPRELMDMDKWQGVIERDPATGMRSYSTLDQMVGHPQVFEAIIRRAMGGMVPGGVPPTGYAQGGRAMPGHNYGSPGLNHMADMGTDGDTELAMVGPNIKRLYDTLARVYGREPTLNPHTGHPQYNIFGDIWSGIKSVGSDIGSGLKDVYNGVVKPVASAVMPVVGQVAQTALPMLGTALGGMEGDPELGEEAGSIGGNLLNSLGGMFGGGSGGGAPAAAAGGGGFNPMQIAQQGAQAMFGNTPYGQVANAMMQGQGGQNGYNPMQMAYQGANAVMNNSPYAQHWNAMMQGQGGQNGYNPMQMAQQGMQSFMGNQGGGSPFQAMANRLGLGGMASRAANTYAQLTQPQAQQGGTAAPSPFHQWFG